MLLPLTSCVTLADALFLKGSRNNDLLGVLGRFKDQIKVKQLSAHCWSWINVDTS